MKPSGLCRICIIGLCLFAIEVGIAFQEAVKPGVTEWNLAAMNDSARANVTKSGDPVTVETSFGKAVLFDGTKDGIFVDENPLRDLSEFTIEVLFRPDPGGLSEQRFFHMGEMSRDRVMLETRLTPEDNWYLDAHIRSGDSALTLIDSAKQHPTGKWYHLAFVVRNGLMEAFVDRTLELRGGISFKPFKGGKTSLGVRQNRVYWFKGALAWIRITPACLEPAEFKK